MALPGVAYAEPDQIMYHTLDPFFENPKGVAHPLLLAPNDPRYSQQWSLKGTWGIKASAAWDITTGASDVVVAMIDTGITSHAEFAGRTVPGYDFVHDPLVANDGNGRDNNPSDPGDWITLEDSYGYTYGGWFWGCPIENSSWHGTHTAGTVGATGNNTVGVAGVNWHSKILPVRVLGKCGGYSSDIMDGMRWAAGLRVPGVSINKHPAKVLSISLGGYGACSASFQAGINEIVAAGSVVVVSAGNSAYDTAFFSPASCDKVITVAATNPTGDQTYYSNYGSKVEISAPGGEMSSDGDPKGILSTLNTGLTGPRADTYGYYQGTSMSAPHVSGVVSLLFSINPKLTPAQVLQILQSSASPFPVGGVCNPTLCGSGIVNAAGALDKAIITISGNVGVAGAKISYVDGTTKTVTADGAGNYSFDVPYHWSGIVTPTDMHHTFLPVQKNYTSTVNDRENQDYTAKQFWYVSGNAGVPGATLTYTDGILKTVASNANGNYSLTVSDNYTGTVTVSRPSYSYAVDHIDYANVTADTFNQDYTPNETLHRISGNVSVSGATMTYDDGGLQTIQSDSSGEYRLLVSDNFAGVITPTKTDVTFTPASMDYSSTPVTAELTDRNFTPTIVLISSAAYDGWILESSENSSAGGSLDSSSSFFQLGDDAQNRQYRAILSFDTSSLPDAAIIQSAVLKIKHTGAIAGTNPFTALTNLWADIRKIRFGTAFSLQPADFNAAASATKVGVFDPKPASSWYSMPLNASGLSNISKANLTQFRLYFIKDDNNNHVADYTKFLSGNSSTNKPTLTITFTLP
jgi:serine protease